MMISVTCVVDVRAADFDQDQLAKVLASLGEVDAVARLEIDESSVDALPRDTPFRVNWASGDIAALQVWSRIKRHGPSYATLDVDGRASVPACLGVIERLFDAGICPLVRPVPPHGVSSIEQLRKQRAPISATTENGADVAPRGMTSNRARILPNGALAGGSPMPVWQIDTASLRSALGEPEGQLFTPEHPWCFSLPDGSTLRQFLGGGTMAMSHRAAHIECQASLGFDDRQTFEEWLAVVTRNEARADGLPVTPAWGRPAPQPLNDDRTLSVSALRLSYASAVVLASALLRGARAEVEEMVGLRAQITGANGFAEGPVLKLSELDDPAIEHRKAKLARHGLNLVASACGRIALSRAPLEARKAAARSLAWLGASDSKMIARWLESQESAEPEIKDLSRRVWTNSSARRTREGVRSMHDGCKLALHLEQQVDRLLTSVAGAR